MDSVKEWSAIVCFAMLSCTMFDFLSPSGKMEKMMRFILGAFVICAVVIPVFKVVSGLNLNYKIENDNKSNISNFISDLEKQQDDVIAVKVKNIIVDELKKIDVKADKIDIFMDTKDKNSISINKTKIFLNKENANKHKEVKNLIEKELSINTEVVF